LRRPLESAHAMMSCTSATSSPAVSLLIDRFMKQISRGHQIGRGSQFDAWHFLSSLLLVPLARTDLANPLANDAAHPSAFKLTVRETQSNPATIASCSTRSSTSLPMSWSSHSGIRGRESVGSLFKGSHPADQLAAAARLASEVTPSAARPVSALPDLANRDALPLA
jgi:hypothetical protein